MGFLSNNQHLLSNIASNGGHGENSSYFDGWKAYDSNPFDPIKNPQGVIQMGLAENQLCHDLMEDWIRRNPKASFCTADGVSAFKSVANFQDYHGLPAFQNAVAKFMKKVRGGGPDFDPDRIVMSGGATGAQETLAFCLADPGDAFLIPTPYYPGFDRDFCWRTGVQLIPVECHSSDDFNITRWALESAFRRARESGIRIKGLLVTNPSNPLGTMMDVDTVKTLFGFVNEKRIHLVVDEIFAGTVFDKTRRFVSVSELLEESTFYDRDLVHVVYSLSKSLGLPGFRVGVIYSYNDAVVACARRMSSFGLVSSQTQHLLASLLSDEDFVDKFLEESSRRLAERHEAFVSGLGRVGIRCLESGAGLFCWMDLRRLLKDGTDDSEMELWRVIVEEVRLNVSPGAAFHCAEPGWFRACFANMDERTVEVALQRIRTFVAKAEETKKKAKEKRWKAAMRLSLPRRFEAEMGMGMGMMTPRLMSPHSPLVHASAT